MDSGVHATVKGLRRASGGVGIGSLGICRGACCRISITITRRTCEWARDQVIRQTCHLPLSKPHTPVRQALIASVCACRPMTEEERAQQFARFVRELLPLLPRPGYSGAQQAQPLMHSPVAGPAKDALREACRVLGPAPYLAIAQHHLGSQLGQEAGHAGRAAQAEVRLALPTCTGTL